MRYTLSSLLSKLGEIENKILDLYRKSVDRVREENLKKLLSEAITDTSKRIEDINWVKDFIVVEMTLEPILGPNIDEFYSGIEETLSKAVTPENFRKAEEKRIEMYREVIKMVENISPETADLLRDFIDRSEKLLSSF